jgi:hypothetical protein
VETIYEDSISLRAYFAKFKDQHKEKVEYEISKINALFDTLDN